MKCVICNQADTRPGMTTVTLERNGSTFIVREVPAQVCPNFGEDYVDAGVAGELLKSGGQSLPFRQWIGRCKARIPLVVGGLAGCSEKLGSWVRWNSQSP